MIGQTSECTKRDFEKYFWGSRKLLQPHEIVCDENEKNKQRKKRWMHKNIIDGRRAFIGYVCKTHALNINGLQVNDC